jgi:NDP-sugar pyrophosphorylase family protein
MIKGPAIIGRNCQIRHNAYFREDVIVGDNCVVGNSCELKNVLMFNNCQVPHFNYVGDSLLGHKAHLGAGVVLSNVKVIKGNIRLEIDGQMVDTGLRKFGALVGDGSEIGCNSVLNPGSIIGRGSVLYPNINWRGILPPHRIVKNKAALEISPRKS